MATRRCRTLLLLLPLTLTLSPCCSAHTTRNRDRRQAGGTAVYECITDSDQLGTCTTLQSCPPLDRLLLLIKRGQASPEQSALLRRETFKCPFVDAYNTPRVCCPDERAGPATPTPPPAPRHNTPSSVTPVTPVTPVSGPGSVTLPNEQICGVRSFLSRIFGGQAAEIGSWPWVASIGYHVTGIKEIRWRCGATLITSHHLVTAAHCVSGLPSDTKPAMARLGEVDFGRDPDCLKSGDLTQCADSHRDVPIESLHPHNLYKGRFGNAFEHDIAVVRLLRSAEPFTDYVRPICLPLDLSRLSGRSDNNVGSRVFVAGWGRADDFSFDDFTPELQEASIRLVDQETCAASYNRSLTAGLGSRLCAGGSDGVDTCRGDSGGPMMAPDSTGTNWYLTGVTSFGSQQCGVRAAVYTRVHDYVDWIQSNL